MTFSPHNHQPDTKIPAHHLGLFFGLTAGLGIYALYSSQKGPDFSQWLKTNAQKIRQELNDPPLSTSSKTYHELVDLIDLIKQQKITPQTVPPPPNFFASLRDHLFAKNQETQSHSLSAPKTSTRHFYSQKSVTKRKIKKSIKKT
jgi:hypothetical protein